eukprot:gene644-8147_t
MQKFIKQTKKYNKLNKFQNIKNYSKFNNIPKQIQEKLDKKIYLVKNHPLNIIKNKIEKYFISIDPSYKYFDNISPKVTTKQCFDDLLFPQNHPSRKPTDTYFFNENECLRTHTTAHQTDLIQKGYNAFLVSGDVYRRDDIDSSHYPIFHQMDAVRIYTKEEYETQKLNSNETYEKFVERKMKEHLNGLVEELFGSEYEKKWIDEYFPFTEPSFEVEILFDNKWMEVLGCGLIEKQIMKNTNQGDKVGYAFGLGLERLAMALFGIQDIRLFWSEDQRFLKQFADGEIKKFTSYSKYPACYKDITFWLPNDNFHDNDFYEKCRDIAGDLIENVELLDHFTHPKTKRESKCYRILYRHMDRNLTNEEVDELQFKLRDIIEKDLKVELR